MRILLICDTFYSVGGVQEVVDHVAYEMIGLGHHVAVLSTTSTDLQRLSRAPVDYIELGIPIPKAVTWRHPERLFRQPKGFDALVEEIRDWNPDVVNSHGAVWDKWPVIVAACRQAGVPLVQSLYGTTYRGKLGERPLRVLAQASALTALSAYTRDFFAQRCAAARQARVITCGVDCAAARAIPAAEHRRPYLICAARLDLQHKALDVLIDAFASLAPRYRDLDLLLAGDGPGREPIAAQVLGHGLQARVKLLGALPRQSLWGLYKGAMMLVLPSRLPEGLGLVFLEAMACGTPVIGTNSGGTPEVVADGVNGLLVADNTAAQIAAAIARLLDDPAARTRMGLAALETAAKYDWLASTPRYLEVYEACTRDVARR